VYQLQILKHQICNGSPHRQALEDLATFLTWYKGVIGGSNLPVVTYGGSYSGALSAWFRLKYPHLTIGSIASSGVVNAILDFTAFDQQVATSAGPLCANLLRNITQLIQSLVLGGTENNQFVKALFNASILTEDGDFFFYIADKMAESVQYGFQDNLCLPLMNAPNQTIENLMKVFANYVITFAAGVLGGPIEYSTQSAQNVTVDINQNWRQWWFQTCAEFGFFQNAPSVNSIRSQYVNMTYWIYSCNAIFGGNLWPNTNATNTYYGGAQIAATNVWFNEGSQDPWQQASVMKTLSPTEPSYYISCHNCGHCVDIVGCPNGCDDNNVALNTGRSKIQDLVVQWLDNA